MTEGLIKAAEVAKILDVSTWQVYQFAAKGTLPGVVRLGGRTVRFERTVIEQWVARRSGASKLKVRVVKPTEKKDVSAAQLDEVISLLKLIHQELENIVADRDPIH